MKINKWLKSKNVSIKDKAIINQMSKLERAKAFGESIIFGTAGIRRPMGLGSSFLNKYTIKMIAYAWIKSLQKHYPQTLKKPFIIAHDSRNNGEEFAMIVAQVVSGMGYKALLFYNNKIYPTPLVSFAIRDKHLGGGVCLTASHNPPIFNGFKCFTEQGQHLMPKRTNLISNELKHITIDSHIPMSKTNIDFLDKTYSSHYLDLIKKKICIDKNLNKNIKIVFSPQHGASYELGPQILRETGFEVFEVEKQSIPNGNFPNTPDPNPENPLAFNEMIDLGKKIGAELLLTTDPDADRVAIGVLHKGKYVLFNGHEAASLLTHYYLNKIKKIKKINSFDYIIKSVVTTSLIDKIALDNNIFVKNALTGYKYIGQIIIDSIKPPLLATEESYGSSICPTLSLDKDSMQLMPIFAEATQYYKNKGKTLVDVLNDIYKKYSFFIHYNAKEKLSGHNTYTKLLKFIDKLSQLKEYPGMKILNIQDFRKGINGFEKTNLVKIIFDDGSWIAVRPSGTESLIRKYFCVKGNTKIEAEKKHRIIKDAFTKIQEEKFNEF